VGAKGYDAAIWTALPRRFKDAIGIPFTPAAALTYLNGLRASTREKALQYILSASGQTMTPFRRLVLDQSAAASTTSPA